MRAATSKKIMMYVALDVLHNSFQTSCTRVSKAGRVEEETTQVHLAAVFALGKQSSKKLDLKENEADHGKTS